MDEVVWSEDLNTGDKLVDFQHRVLFNYLNMLIVARKDRAAQRSTLEKILGALIEYTVLHFEDEEKLLESMGYPDLAKHQKIHRDCARQVVHLKERFESGEDVLVDVISFVKSWIMVHIKEEDMKALRYKA